MKRRAELSVAMIARDAEGQIGRALDSVIWADEICVADTGSRDRTKEVAARFGARVASVDFSSGFGRAKQAAVRMTTNDWILSLDSDEVVTPELRRSIEQFLLDCDAYAGARVGRITNLCGHWIHHSGWYPEYVLRLFNKKHAGFDDSPLHESIKFNGKIKRLSGCLLHYSYPDLAVYVRKTREYARWGALKKRQLPVFMKLLCMLIKPAAAFIRKFLLQRGFMDGLPGLWIACFTSGGQFLKYYYALRRK
ncbi:MAG TPA: glycosyltransferase family 2 protein [candidate division Zixibacteria bacterium]|nr:glycosyltransferase family 2 protein [candidate division Zixibacteria bacterium]HER00547.1 glycosyltransferase family 2 protein [candidate division Zixibacteria bacterium]